MKKLFVLSIAAIMLFTLVACDNGNKAAANITPPTQAQNISTASTEVKTAGDKKQVHVASEGAKMQKDDPTIATRVVEGGTKINIHFGNVVIPGTLNDSITAQDLISKLPYTVHVSRYSHDFCGVMNNLLKYKEDEVHYGWLNGDIDFATDANYFTILFEDEKKSEQFGSQVNIGKIDCKLEEISKLTGSYDVLIELVK